MSHFSWKISPQFKHRLFFSRDVFSSGQFFSLFPECRGKKILVFVDEGVFSHFPQLNEEISTSLSPFCEFQGIFSFLGGERAKAGLKVVEKMWQVLEEKKLDRHSYLLAIGGGAFLDVAGFVATTAHRGVRLIRFPTSTLAQADSGVGVKNGVNLYGKKNFIGTFSVPFAVVNDSSFLASQPRSLMSEGLVEAVKVALVKDKDFFTYIENHLSKLQNLDFPLISEVVRLSAIAHSYHIAEGGDPFELKNFRPLDFGHWAAHKLEAMSDFSLNHSSAVAIGLALDCVYSWKIGKCSEEILQRVLFVLESLQMPCFHPLLLKKNSSSEYQLFLGLEEFREHLGGHLSILLLKDIGDAEEVHSIDFSALEECVLFLQKRYERKK